MVSAQVTHTVHPAWRQSDTTAHGNSVSRQMSFAARKGKLAPCSRRPSLPTQDIPMTNWPNIAHSNIGTIASVNVFRPQPDERSLAKGNRKSP
jgi:hypothetical protein